MYVLSQSDGYSGWALLSWVVVSGLLCGTASMVFGAFKLGRTNVTRADIAKQFKEVNESVDRNLKEIGRWQNAHDEEDNLRHRELTGMLKTSENAQNVLLNRASEGLARMAGILEQLEKRLSRIELNADRRET